MATVGTSTQSALLSYPTVPSIVREMSTQTALADIMYCAIRTAADTITIYRTTNEGSSWSSYSSFTHTGLQEWSSPYLDRFGGLHMAYRINTGTADVVYYRRMLCSTGAWSAAVQVSATDANGGVAGSRWQGLDLVAVRNSNGSTSIAICGAYAQGSTQYGMTVMGVTITAGGQVSVNNKLIINNRFFFEAGTYPGYTTVACEVEHNGDGITASTPNLWVVWGRTKLRMVKLAWQGTAVGWTGPSNFQVIQSSISAHNFVGGRWDGKQWLMCTASPDDATMVRVYQRNQANTLTTTYDTLTHPTGNITAMATSYDMTTKNIRVFAVGTSTTVLYYCDYSRTLGTWSSWSSVVATAVLGGTEWSVRRGGSHDNSKIDVITTASGSPNTVTHTGQAISSVPYVPVMTSPAGRYNGGPADVGSALPLSWVFYDQDPGASQGSYAISRQIGSGSLTYWRASDQTWQASEVQNTSATPSATIPSGWAADADAAYTFKVKVWDNTGTPSASYSDPYVLVPSSPVNPSFSAPSSGGTITTDKVTVSWTVAQQRAYRVIIDTNPATQVVYDSGWVTSTDTSLTVPVSLANGGAYTITLYTQNNELLASAAQTRNFSVQFAAPPAPYPTLTPVPASGYITVGSAANAAVGSQPAIDTLALYRRPAITATLNANSDLTSNVTGYGAGGGSTGPVTWTSAQTAPTSPGGAARMVPDGTTGTAQVESPQVTIDGTKTYMGTAWIRPDTANKPAFIAVNFFTSGGSYITSKSLQLTTPVALAWQFMQVIADASTVSGAAKASISIGLNTTPAVGDALYVDDLRLRLYDDTTGVRVANGLSHPASVNDWGAASGIAYEYRWAATSTTGTAINGPWIS